jgi:hypothetical protein
LQSTCQIWRRAFWQHFVAFDDLEALAHFPVICTLAQNGETFPKESGAQKLFTTASRSM